MMHQTTYEASTPPVSIVAAGSYAMTFTTGPTHAIFLDRTLGFHGGRLVVDVFKDPAYTGGTVVPSYMLDIGGGSPSRGILRAGMTLTSPGTKVAATSYYDGSKVGGVGHTVVGTYGTQRGYRRLAPFTTYAVRITNDSPDTQEVSIYFRWYEGPDPTPEGG